MASDADISALTRAVKGVDVSLAKIARALEAMNNNYVEVNRRATDTVEKDPNVD